MDVEVLLILGVGTVVTEYKEVGNTCYLSYPALVNKIFAPDGRIGYSLDPLLPPLGRDLKSKIEVDKNWVLMKYAPSDLILDTYKKIRAEQIQRETGIVIPTKFDMRQN